MEKFKCKANITYEFTIMAESKEDAENEIFNTIADSIGEGIIPLDIYDNNGCFPIPMLESVDVSPFEIQDAK